MELVPLDLIEVPPTEGVDKLLEVGDVLNERVLDHLGLQEL
jgi:hypothetical protein